MVGDGLRLYWNSRGRAVVRLALGLGMATVLTHAPFRAEAAEKPITGSTLVIQLQKAVMENTAFRRVLMTGKHIQLVAMHLAAGQNIDMETHPDNDQMVLVVAGQVETTVDGKKSRLQAHQTVLIPAGAAHDVRADGGKAAKILVFYAPPLHPAGEVEKTKPMEGH